MTPVEQQRRFQAVMGLFLVVIGKMSTSLQALAVAVEASADLVAQTKAGKSYSRRAQRWRPDMNARSKQVELGEPYTYY